MKFVELTSILFEKSYHILSLYFILSQFESFATTLIKAINQLIVFSPYGNSIKVKSN